MRASGATRWDAALKRKGAQAHAAAGEARQPAATGEAGQTISRHTSRGHECPEQAQPYGRKADGWRPAPGRGDTALRDSGRACANVSRVRTEEEISHLQPLPQLGSEGDFTPPAGIGQGVDGHHLPVVYTGPKPSWQKCGFI